MSLHSPALGVTFPRHRTVSGLVMTDYTFLLGLGLAMLVAVDPLEVLLERSIYTKHLPMMFVFASVILTLIGSRLFTDRPRREGSLPTLAPMMALAGFIVLGGMYARFVLDIRDSFLVGGAYMWAAPMVAAVLLRCADPVRMMRIYFALMVLFGVIVFAGLAKAYGVRQVFHELQYLFPALAVLFAFGARRRWVRIAGISFFLVVALLFKKNTGYLAGLIALAYLLVFYFWPQWSRKDIVTKASAAHWTFIGLLLLGGLIAYLVMNRATYLPSGSPEFRLLTYEIAFLRFLDSPIYGTLFTAPGAEFFLGFDTGVASNILPTHSDTLDILANGGLVAFTLLVWGLWRVGRLALRTVLHPRHRAHPLAPYGHTLACMSIAGVVTYTFNPIILQPGKALLLWANLGFLVAVALLVGREEKRNADSARTARRANHTGTPGIPSTSGTPP